MLFFPGLSVDLCSLDVHFPAFAAKVNGAIGVWQSTTSVCLCCSDDYSSIYTWRDLRRRAGRSTASRLRDGDADDGRRVYLQLVRREAGTNIDPEDLTSYRKMTLLI